MADKQEIDAQKSILKTARKTLQYLLEQAIAYGGIALAPPQVRHSIDEMRSVIAECKTVLRAINVKVDDCSIDEDICVTPLRFGVPTQADNPEESQIRTFPSLGELRAAITTDRQILLDAIWDHWSRTYLPIPLRVLHKTYGGREVVRPMLEALGGCIVHEIPKRDNPEGYQLTFLGALLTSHASHFELLLMCFLDYLRDVEPDCVIVSSQDIAHAYGFNDDTVILLGDLVYLGNLFVITRGPQMSEWKVDVTAEVEHITEESLRYIHTRAMHLYDPKMPLGEMQRQRIAARRV